MFDGRALRDRVRLCMMQPVSPSAALVVSCSDKLRGGFASAYFRVLDDLLDVMTRRLYLRLRRCCGVLRRRGIWPKVESKSRRRKTADRKLILLTSAAGSYPIGQLHVIIGNRQ